MASRLLEFTPIHMMADALSSTLRTTGLSTPSGRRPAMRETASRTSEAASSGLRETLNWMLTDERSSWLCDEIWSMPSMPATADSITSVIRFSMTSLAAPR
jgi:hypothetical protein